MAKFRKIKTVFHNDEQYDLIMMNKKHEDYATADRKDTIRQGWTVLASVKKDKRTLSRAKKAIKKRLFGFKIASIISLICGSLFAFAAVQLHNLGMFNVGYAVIIAASGIIGLTAVGFSIFFLVKWLMAKSKGLASSYAAFIEDDMRNDDLVSLSKSEIMKRSECHNNYSLITPVYDNNSIYKYTFKDIQKYVDHLSEDELAYFMVKGYELGKCNDDINEARELLSKNKRASNFLKDETENKLKKLKNEHGILSAIQMKENQKFLRFMDKNSHNKKQEEELEEWIRNIHERPLLNSKNDADEELLEFLSVDNDARKENEPYRRAK